MGLRGKQRTDLIKWMLEEVEAAHQDRDYQNEFIISIRRQFDERGDLSDKQIDALRKFYERETA